MVLYFSPSAFLVAILLGFLQKKRIPFWSSLCLMYTCTDVYLGSCDYKEKNKCP